MLLDTNFVQATPPGRINDVCTSAFTYFITEQGCQECAKKALTLPDGTTTVSGYGWGDFVCHGRGFYTFKTASGSLLQAWRDKIRWWPGRKYECAAHTLVCYEGQTFHVRSGVAEDPVDFSYFVTCMLDPGVVLLTLDKDLGWALGERAVFGYSVENLQSWSDVTPELLKAINQSRAAFNSISSCNFVCGREIPERR